MSQDKQMEQDRDRIRQAYNQGLLDPLIKYLERMAKNSSKPIKVDGPEWPLKRAAQDGEAGAYLGMLAWLSGRINISPDEAQNTED